MTGAVTRYLFGMKQIEGRATRVQKYSRLFFWYVPACGVLMAILGVAGAGWAWGPGLLIALGGIAIGAVLGVLLRNVP